MTRIELVSARLLLGYTRPQFAERLGLTIKCVESWEYGAAKPSKMAQKFIETLLYMAETGADFKGLNKAKKHG